MPVAIEHEPERSRPVERTSVPSSLAFELDPATRERAEKIRLRMTNPFMLRAFLWAKVPAAAFAGVRLRELTPERCRTTVPYGWRSTNPFRSIYFAAQAMAAELSTGALAMMAIESLCSGDQDVSIAMLITGTGAEFSKKANAVTTFTCGDGSELFAAVERAKSSGEPQLLRVETIGRMPDGTEVSRFHFDWSFKRRD